ncbi:MAG TPA: SPFH domain-containing protein [bacterium]|nr:SPFH domain-containing protein [bacterium]
MELTAFIAIAVVLVFLMGIRIVRPTHQLVVETLGKYTRTGDQGFNWIIPIFQKGNYVNITERMVDIMPQTVITKDNLNAVVDAVVYYQIKDSRATLYNVDDHESQLTSLARTTLRAVIGQMSFTQANENRDQINLNVETILDKETKSYGVEVLRVEIQKIEAPQDVQQAMNEVVKAERKKIAARDQANAVEIEAEGMKRAEIQKADGIKQARILEAEGRAEAIRLENEAAQKYFVGNAQLLKKLEAAVEALQNNTKIVLPEGKELVNVIGDLAGVAPLPGI